MATTRYSHAFLVGNFNYSLKPKQLEKDKNWERIIVSENDYSDLCSMYYQSHIDAMLETDGRNNFRRIFAKGKRDCCKPSFLCKIRHYQYEVREDEGTINICEIQYKYNEIIATPFVDYILKIQKLHIYFFPLDIVLFAIEIDDSKSLLDACYTEAHQLLRTWCWTGRKEFSKSTKKQLNTALAPLAKFLDDNSLSNLISEGNKLKLFQIIHLDDAELYNDKTLYEIATCSPLGVVGSDHDMDPSKDYYNSILKVNKISTFKNWTGLALVDSFTVIGQGNDFNTWPFSNLYFQFIYLRCVLEKEFCFSRNNKYRLNKVKGDLLTEIAQMEKYYFYDNISHNFQPNLLYKAMSKGLCVKEERELLAKQIKEKEESKSNRLLAFVSVFAVFSIAFDLYSILRTWLRNNIQLTNEFDVNWDAMSSLNSPDGEMPLLAMILTILAFAASAWLVRKIYKRREV